MRKSYKIYRIVVLIITCITILSCIMAKKSEGYEYIGWIPFIYLIMFSFSRRFNRYSIKYSGIFLLNLLMFLKYVVAILFVCIIGTYSLPNYYVIYVMSSSYHIATLLIIGEMISLFLSIELLSDSIFKKTRDIVNQKVNESIFSTDTLKYKKIKIGPVLIVFLLFCFVLIILYPNYFFGKVMIIFSSGNQLTENIESSNALNLFFYAFKIIVIGIVINNCIINYNNTKKKIYILCSYFLIGTFCILNISTSRINIIIPFLLFILITSKTFKKTGVILNAVIVVFLGVLLGIVSVYKMPYIYTDGSLFQAFLFDFAKRVQEYTANIMPTAIGLQAIDEYSSLIGIHTFFIDILDSVPLVSHFFSEKDSIYYIYNQYALGGSSNTQIIPMTVSSIAYFSPVFSFLLVDIFAVILMVIEKRKNRNSDNFVNDYLYLYIIFVFASCTFSNVQMITGRFFANFFAAYCIMYFNRRLKL